MVVRGDLPKGVLAAQVCHAAGESSPGNLPEGTYAVVLTSEQLEELSAELGARGVKHKRIIENDAPYAGELMALGLEPAPRSALKRHLRQLRLLR